MQYYQTEAYDYCLIGKYAINHKNHKNRLLQSAKWQICQHTYPSYILKAYTYAPITVHLVLYTYTTECVCETGLYLVNQNLL